MLKIVVVGASNLDIRASSNKKMQASDSNPGTVGLYAGGVGRNLAKAFSLFGDKVTFMTALGDDQQSILIKNSLKGIDTICPKTYLSSGTYVCLEDYDGKLLYAVNDMAIADAITPGFLESNYDTLMEADVIVFEANLTQDAIDYLGTLDKPLACDAVSTFKASKLKSVFPKLAYCKMNKEEAKLLASLDQEASFDELIEALRYGDRTNLVSLGPQGACLFNHKDFVSLPSPKLKPVSVNGAGDALFAGTVHSLEKGVSYQRALECAMKACSLSLLSLQAISEDLGPYIFD